MALSAADAISQSGTTSPKLPHLDGLAPLYRMGVEFRQGQVVMVAGRSGSMKSSFTLWLVETMGLETMYFSADMSASQASLKIGAMRTQQTTDQVERQMLGEGREEIIEELRGSKVRFSFKSPIRPEDIILELNAWVTMHNAYPQAIVIDNLMDVEGAEADYSALTFAMQILSDLSRETGASIFVLHHASDKSWEADSQPYRPPSRKEVKYGLSEKPELSLGVAINNQTNDFHIAPIKQRLGFQDPTANTFATIRVIPEKNFFHSPSVGDYIPGASGG